MYPYHQKSQHDECLICFSPLLQTISLSQLCDPMPICQRCLCQFHVLDWHMTFHHYPLRILYEYNDFFKTLLFQYKGLYDYALKDVFLCLYAHELKQRYHDYTIVVAPSHQQDNQQRGFAPMETLAKTFSKQVFDGLYKKERYKQSASSYSLRKAAEEKIEIVHKEQLKGKKVLIFDDVITSSATLQTCLSLVESCQVQCIELLVLSTKRTFEEIQNRGA